MECGGKRSATPLWLVFVSYSSQNQPLKPKRRRASLAAALHRVPGRDTPEFEWRCGLASWQLNALRSRGIARDALRLADHPFKFLGPRIGSVNFRHAAQITQQTVGRDLRRIRAAG